MKVILDDTYFIESDGLNYILKSYKLSTGKGKNKDKSGKPRVVEAVEGYYTLLTFAVRAYIRKVGESKTEDFVGDLKAYVDRIENVYENAIKVEIKKVCDDDC